ncbi:MAG: cytochrome c [Peptococcaceae bacterium]|jgi:mono/diheme cytochrome c family protein|nr:cytochrome c [Peptococcaceae bacterium]MDR2737297.1 cytochrome c [Gracilibacteraceae bacterium]
MNLSKTLVATLILVGTVIGFMLFAPYAVPPQPDEDSQVPGAQTFVAVCTSCHETDRIQSYSKDLSWAEIVTLMESFGAMISEEEAGEIENYLNAAYPGE